MWLDIAFVIFSHACVGIIGFVLGMLVVFKAVRDDLSESEESLKWEEN